MTPTNTGACTICGEIIVRGGALKSHEIACAKGGPKRRRRTRYRELFFAHSGFGPYDCWFCGEDVDFESVIVHHVDEDETNNDIVNLVAAHRLCHSRHHFKGIWEERREELLASPTRGHHTPHTEETKRALSEAAKSRGAAPTAAAIEAARLVNTGKPRSPETRRKISEGHRARRALNSIGGGANGDRSADQNF